MLAPRTLPRAFAVWNQQWKAPFGPRWAQQVPLARRFRRYRARQLGPFAYQFNNTTRLVEYPWAFHIATLSPGMTVLEIGGGLSGLQFVLARAGARVITVDPFVEYGAGDYAELKAPPRVLHAKLNRYFGTSVELRMSTLEDAHLPPDSVDRIYSISTIEHLDTGALTSTLAGLSRVLRPGGLFVATVDLFLDLRPFCRRERNRFGVNVSIAELVSLARMSLVWGTRAELFGFSEFDVDTVISKLADYHVGQGYPALAQLFVLQKPGASAAAGTVRADVFAASDGNPPRGGPWDRTANRLRWYGRRIKEAFRRS